MITDFVKFQNFVAHYLSSYNALDNVNIVTRDRLLADESRLPDETLAAEVLAYITPRSGRVGAGIIVEKPGFEVGHPNLPGPEGDITIELLVLEDRITNNSPSEGTGLPADQICQIIMDALHWQQWEGFGQIFCDRQAMSPAKDFQPLDGYRVKFRLRLSRSQTVKVQQPVISENSGVITLTCLTSGAQIYYTLDESFPGRSNPVAVLYSGSFTVDVGTVINAAAYLDGSTPSHMIQATTT
jgi:hypothetical protein